MNCKMEYTYITRSAPKNIEQLEKLNGMIPNDYFTYNSSDKKAKIFKELDKYMNDFKNSKTKDDKLEKNKIIWNNMIYDDKFHFLFKNKNFRKTTIDKIKYFSTYDKNFYMYIPYLYKILVSVKNNKFLQ
jgi:hypothetical protein